MVRKRDVHAKVPEGYDLRLWGRRVAQPLGQNGLMSVPLHALAVSVYDRLGLAGTGRGTQNNPSLVAIGTQLSGPWGPGQRSTRCEAVHCH